MKEFVSPARLEAVLDAFRQAKVLVVGDFIADEFLLGEISRISREAPVLILKHQKLDLIPGGAGNAACNAASLGGFVAVIGAVGIDSAADRLKEAFAKCGIETSGLVADASRPTTTKTRIAASSHQSVTQQIVRIDQEANHPLDAETEAKVMASMETWIPQVDAVLLSDYGNGVLTPAIIEKANALCKAHNKVLTVDSQGDLSRFHAAWAITPNQPEAEAVVGYKIQDHDSLLKAGADLRRLSGSKSVLITRGANGIALFEENAIHEIPAFNRSEVFDVTGAGDTVIATLTLALAAKASPLEATALANLAASIVVRRFGTSTTSPEEMREGYEKILAEENKVLHG